MRLSLPAMCRSPLRAAGSSPWRSSGLGTSGGWDATEVATFTAAGLRLNRISGNRTRRAHSPAAGCLLLLRALALIDLPPCLISPRVADGQISATVEWLAWHQTSHETGEVCLGRLERSDSSTCCRQRRCRWRWFRCPREAVRGSSSPGAPDRPPTGSPSIAVYGQVYSPPSAGMWVRSTSRWGEGWAGTVWSVVRRLRWPSCGLRVQGVK